jgi:hypothetical protein
MIVVMMVDVGDVASDWHGRVVVGKKAKRRQASAWAAARQGHGRVPAEPAMKA